MTPEQQAQLEVFKKERNDALLSLDVEKIQDFYFKWNGYRLSTDNMDIFWGSVHKAITSLTSLPLEFRQKSKDYLTQHGLRSHDDGDLK